MFLYLNSSQVIIDIMEHSKPVCKNKNNLFVFCDDKDAIGYIGNEDRAYAKAGLNFLTTFTDVANVVEVDVPANVERLAWKYVDGEFVENEDGFPLDNQALTNATEQNSADIEYIAIMSDIDI